MIKTKYILVILISIFSVNCYSDWDFSWNTRTDRDGKPAGMYDITPFPITRYTSHYTITTDEGATTYILGTKYFVDGGYTGGNSDGSWDKPWTSISQAIYNVDPGNVTIIVRGAHDEFDGVYYDDGFTLKSGIDDTHRFTLVGYGNERPVIDAGEVEPPGNNVVYAYYDTAFATIQRFKIQNSYKCAIRMGGSDSYINVIDMWLYHNNKWDFENDTTWADGNLYFLGSSNCWIYHTLSEHTDGHAFKLGDGVEDCIVEWSVAREAGYWDGYYLSYRSKGHPTAMDLPADGVGFDMDNDGKDDFNLNCIVRYNIIYTSLFYNVQLRKCINFDFHHNEIFDGIHFGEVGGCLDRSIGGNQVIIFADKTSGNFHSNIIRDPGNNEVGQGIKGIRISECSNPDYPINIYNNLIYGHDEDSISISDTNDNAEINIMNNSLYADNNYFLINYGTGNETTVVNNILYQNGTGACADYTGADHYNNQYYAPNGNIGTYVQVSEITGDPMWKDIPEGVFSWGEAYPDSESPSRGAGVSLSTIFTKDANSFDRAMDNSWDLGAFEFSNDNFTSDVPTLIWKNY